MEKIDDIGPKFSKLTDKKKIVRL